MVTMMDNKRKNSLVIFQRYNGINFHNTQLLNLALSHRSYAHENGEFVNNNERLEFLGDAILGLVIADHLYKKMPDKTEGDLTRMRSYIVSESSLAIVARRMGIEKYLLVGKGEECSNGREKPAILSDSIEAILGAYFLDSGFRSTRKLILKLFISEISKARENKHQQDYKTLLQEYVQKRFRLCPIYTIVKKNGPDHDLLYWINVCVNQQIYGPGIGRSKKEAERKAAEMAYHSLSHKFLKTKY